MTTHKEKMSITDIEVQQINESHKTILMTFKSYEKELIDFLVEDALDNQKKQMSVTYLWFLKSTKELVSYLTILADAKRNTNSRKDSVHFYKKFGFEILKQREKGTTPMYKDLIKE